MNCALKKVSFEEKLNCKESHLAAKLKRIYLSLAKFLFSFWNCFLTDHKLMGPSWLRIPAVSQRVSEESNICLQTKKKYGESVLVLKLSFNQGLCLKLNLRIYFKSGQKTGYSKGTIIRIQSIWPCIKQRQINPPTEDIN